MKGNQEEEILEYVKRLGSIRWNEVEKRFVTVKGWSKGKFVNHWKKVLPYLQKTKDPDTGRPRYTIRTQFKDVALKALLRTEIIEGEIGEVKIPLERFGKVADYIAEQVSPAITRNILENPDSDIFCKEIKKNLEERRTQIKDEREKRPVAMKVKALLKHPETSEEEGQIAIAEMILPLLAGKLRTKDARKTILEQLESMKIQIVCDPGETMPTLTDKDIADIFNIVTSKRVDENKNRPRERPFHLIVSFPMK